MKVFSADYSHMPGLAISLLGPFVGSADGRPLQKFRSNRSQALLMYLVTESALGAPFHQRESLMDLLWRGLSLKSAQVNLRQALYQLRQAIPAVSSPESQDEINLLLTDRRTVQVNPDYPLELDVAQFTQALNGHQRLWPEAVDLYRGDFLADFYLADANTFEEWATARRAGFQRQMLDALASLAEVRIGEGRYGEAEGYARRQLELDPLREKGHRQLMILLALDGRRSEALAQYEACRQLLGDELGVEPSARTQALQAAILAGEVEEAGATFEHLRGYELKESLGVGSFGMVHRAIQPSIGREVAIKTILSRYANDPEFIRRFEAEAQRVAHVEHPFIVPLYDYWREPDNAYLVMRYLKGGSLLSALEAGPWDPGLAGKMLDQLGSALSAAHQQGIIHRDIKPANILLDESGNAYLADFGIAKDLGGGRQMTAMGAVTGTPDYMSPEQILNEPVGPQTDIYSLGVVLYETLTGEKPFSDSSIVKLLNKHLEEPFPLVSASRPDLPAQIDEVIHRATAKRPAERYADALEMAEAFRVVVAGRDMEIIGPTVLPGIEVTNPYKGLRAFQEADADDFYGRVGLVEQLIFSAADSRFLALVGPSGSGKSSAIKAGLIPALRNGVITSRDGLASSDKWFVAEMTPGSHPLDELELALWPIAVDPPPSLVEPMQHDTRGLLRTIRRILPGEEGPHAGPQLLLIIDQFEELFTLVEDDERREFFIGSLLTAVRDPRSPLRVIVALRADFYDRPLQMQSLGRLLKENTEVVLPLTPEELTWAIREPALKVGVRLEPGLAEAIVADVSDQPGGLPLLQFALTEMFEGRQDNLMTLKSYQEIGGVAGALGRRADEIYKGLDEAGQEATRQLFMRLVTLGEGMEDTRRRVLRSELEAIGNEQLIINIERSTINDPESPDDLLVEGKLTIKNSQFAINNSSVIDAFGAARLLTFDRDPATREPTVEVAHEALLREWGQLRRWLDESRNDVRTLRMLSAAATDWADSGQNDGYLLQGARLELFASWAASSTMALTDSERAFLDASIAARDMRRAEEEERRRRELETARKLAETEAKRAEEQAEAARRLRQRALMLAGVVVVAVILAIAAVLFGQDANRNADLAATQEAEAFIAAKAEATAAAGALEQQAIAEQERATAEEQALVARSRELAAASGNSLGTDPELGLLLAVEALTTVHTGEAEQALHTALMASRVRQRLVGPEEEPIQRMAYSPDGSLIALAAYSEEMATIWDAASGHMLYELSVAGCCWGLYFDDDGQRLAAVEPGENFSLATWDMTTGEKSESFPLPLAVDDVSGAYYLNPDWTQVAISLRDGSAAVWDIRKGERLFDLPGHTGFVELEYSQDGSRLVTYDSPDGLVMAWDADTGEIVRRIDAGQGVSDHAVSPDGRRLALAMQLEGASEVQIWDLDETKADELLPALRLTGHGNDIRVLAFSPEGQLIASASDDGTSRLWDTSTGEELLVLLHGEGVRSVIFHPEGNRLLTGDYDGDARIWDITPQGVAERLTLAAHDAFVKSIASSPDERYLATASFDGTAKIWDLTTGQMVHSLEGHEGRVMSIAYHPDGRRVATASTDGTVRVWDGDSGDVLLRLDGHGEGLVGETFPGVLGVVYSSDGEHLVSVGADKTVRIWDSESGEEVQRLEGHEGGIASLAISPDGVHLATGSNDPDTANSEVRIWDANTGQERIVLSPSQGTIWGLDFSPDGRFLATSGNDASAKIWALDIDAGSAEMLATLEGHVNTVVSVRFSPDGQTLATATNEEVRLWDLHELGDETEGGSVSEFLLLPGGAGLAFNQDGSELITAGRDGLLRVYLLDSGELMSLAESRLTRWWTEAECRQYLHRDSCPEPGS